MSSGGISRNRLANYWANLESPTLGTNGATMANHKPVAKPGPQPTPPDTIAGEALKLAIDRYWKRSQSQLAVKAGVSRETINRYVKGEIKAGPQLESLCGVLQVFPEKILEGIVEEIPIKLTTIPEQEASRMQGMLADILDTPAGDYFGTQVEALHRKLFPNDHG